MIPKSEQMLQCEVALIDYFGNHLKDLTDPDPKIGYRWKIRNIKGFEHNGHDNYDANVKLKKHFHDKWHAAERAEKCAIAKEIVTDWGRVTNHNDGTLPSYVDELEKKHPHTPSTPLKGVASYSKIFSIADLDNYAIYDSRVAACLNAIQYNYNRKNNTKGGIAFHYVPGRNNIIGTIKPKTREKIGFVHQPQFKRSALVACESGWEDIGKNQTYATYLETLTNCLKHFPTNKIYDLEMLLFSNAEKECAKAMA